MNPVLRVGRLEGRVFRNDDLSFAKNSIVLSREIIFPVGPHADQNGKFSGLVGPVDVDRHIESSTRRHSYVVLDRHLRTFTLRLSLGDRNDR